MRKTHETVLRAFLKGKRRKVNNLETDGKTVWLHGNAVIWRSVCGDTDQPLYVLTLAGWPTVTTREVLNAFVSIVGGDGFTQRSHVQHYGNNKIEPFDCVEIAA